MRAFPASPVGCSRAPLRCGPFGTAFGPFRPLTHRVPERGGSAPALQKEAAPSLSAIASPPNLLRGGDTMAKTEGASGGYLERTKRRKCRNAETWTFRDNRHPRECSVSGLREGSYSARNWSRIKGVIRRQATRTKAVAATFSLKSPAANRRCRPLCRRRADGQIHPRFYRP